MEKLFQPKFAVPFCAVFLLVVGGLKYVSDARLKQEGQRWAAMVFDWSWPDNHWSSKANELDAVVVSHNEHDAVVEVKGKQVVAVDSQPQIADCTATLKLYKRGTARGDVWELGEVQFP